MRTKKESSIEHTTQHSNSSIPMNKKNATVGVRIQKGQIENAVEWRVSMASLNIPDTWLPG